MTNDRFKFRAWDGKNMGYQDEFGSFRPNLNTTNYNNQIIGLNIAIKDEKIKVMQATGLKNKNGKLIYEGDVVLFKDDAGRLQKGVINWWEYAYFANALGGDDEGNQDIELHPDYLKDVEVIGNIYENPKLLENDK